MAHDGCQTPSWYGQAFSYLPKTHRAEPHQAPPSAASAFAAAVSTSGGYRSQLQVPSAPAAAQASAEDALRAARTGTWDGPAPRGRGKGAAPVEPVKPAPASKTETSVSLRAGRKRLPLCGIQFGGGAEADFSLGAAETSSSPSSSLLPLNVVVDVENEASVSAVAAALQGLSDQQREKIFLTLVLDATELESAVRSADGALSRLGRGTADLVLLDWSKVIDYERQTPSERENGCSQTLWKLAAKRLVEGGASDGRRRARAMGLANAGLADVERLLSLAEAEATAATAKSSAAAPAAPAPAAPAPAAPRPVALAVELHPLLPQRKLVGVCRRKGVAVIALNPAGSGGEPETKALLLGNAAVAAAAAAENKSPREVLLRWSAEQGIPFVASSSSASSSVSSSVSEVAAAPSWALSPASRDGLDGAAAAAGSAAELRTLVPKAGAGFAWPVAAEGGAGKASEALLLQKQ